MKKKICSFVLIIAMLAMLLPSGLVGTTVYAESLGLSYTTGWAYATHRATTTGQIDNVYNLAKSQTTTDVANRLYKALYSATYRPKVNGGSEWFKGNDESLIYSVTDNGLGTTISITGSKGCASYGYFISKYIRNNGGSKKGFAWGYVPSADEIKNDFVQYADPGEHIHFTYNTGGGEHSIVYLASDDDGFYFLSAPGKGNIDVFYTTYSHFHDILKAIDYYTVVLYDTNSGKDIQNSYFDAPPSDPKLTIYTNSVAAGKPILFEYSVKNAENIYILIDVNGVREHFIEVSGDHYNGTFTKPGNYSAALYATNSVGNSGFSNWVNFVVYNTVPKNPKIAIYKKFVPAGEPILFEYSIDYAQNMYIPIDVNGTREHFIEVSGDHYNGTFTKPGYYSAALYATNEFGESEFSNWVDFVVYNTAPNPPSNIHSIKNSYTNKERISISWDEENTATNYWIYLWKDGEEILSQSNGINTTKDFGLLSVGNYTVLVRSENKFGVSNTSSFLFSVTESEYVISYDANGGMGAPATQTKTHGENLTLTTNKPTRNGYEFIGWSTDKNATSQTYTAGATFTIDADTMLFAVWKQISSIEIVTMPDKLNYNNFDSLDISGLKIKVRYSDGTTKDITMGMTVVNDDSVTDITSGTTCYNFDSSKLGIQEILVAYNGVTTTYNVNVDDPFITGIEIEKLPDKLVYNVGDTLDITGISVLKVISDGSSITRKIDEGYTCTPTVLNSAGTQEITVDYYGRTATFNVTVNRVLTSVTVKTNPDKLVYTMGDTLDPTGLVLTASYNDG